VSCANHAELPTRYLQKPPRPWCGNTSVNPASALGLALAETARAGLPPILNLHGEAHRRPTWPTIRDQAVSSPLCRRSQLYIAGPGDPVQLRAQNPVIVLEDADLDPPRAPRSSAFMSTGQNAPPAPAMLERSTTGAVARSCTSAEVCATPSPRRRRTPASKDSSKPTSNTSKIAKGRGPSSSRSKSPPAARSIKVLVEPTLPGSSRKCDFAQKASAGPPWQATPEEPLASQPNALRHPLLDQDLSKPTGSSKGRKPASSWSTCRRGRRVPAPLRRTKESSFGMREQGTAAADFFSETRTVYLKHR